MRRPLALLTALATLIAGLVVGTAAPAQAADPATVLTPQIVPMSAPEIANPQRGQYKWMDYPTVPAGWPGGDYYERDRVYLGRIQTGPDTFNTAPLDAGLSQVGQTKDKFSFRIMSYCPGCWMNSRATWPDWGPVYRSFLPSQGTDSSGLPIPDWNSEAYLANWEKVMGYLGKKYNSDPRLGYIDMGGYGDYGEQHASQGTPITKANWLRMLRAVSSNFPNHHVLVNTMTPVDWTTDAVASAPNVGIRTDNIGCPKMYSMVPDNPSLQDIWKTRPFMSEWCTRPDITAGRDQVRTYHISNTSSSNFNPAYTSMTSTQQADMQTAAKSAGYRYQVSSMTLPTVTGGGAASVTIQNVGSAPTYDPWKLSLRVKSGTGATTEVPLALDLRKILPGSTTYSFTMPALPKDTYSVSLRATDAASYSLPLRFANPNPDSGGWYPMGGVTLTEGPARTAPTAAPTPASAVAMQPTRVFDSRTTGSPVRAGTSVNVTIGGRNGVPSTGVEAVVVNLTAVAPSANGYLTQYPTGAAIPATSTLNFVKGRAIAKMSVAKLGTNGQLSLRPSADTHLLVDVAGYLPTGGSYVALSPQRIVDTRTGTGAPKAPVAGSGTLPVTACGVASIPCTAKAVATTTTVVPGASGGYLTAYPNGTTRPTASNVNYAANEPIAGAILAKLGTGGIFNLTPSTTSNLLVDVTGYFPASSPYVPVNPARILDTRNATGTPLRSMVPAGGSVKVKVAGAGGVPTTARTVVLNVTSTGSTASGWVSAGPALTTTSSMLNHDAGQTIANATMVPVAADGTITLYSSSASHLITDVTGYF